jgi:predicted transcriptional regulator
MRSNVHWLPDDMPLERAAEELARRHVTGAPVCASDGRIVGVLSGTDLARSFGTADDERRVQDVMTREVVAVGPDDTLEHVVHLMVLEHVHRVLVLDRADHLLGLVSSMDVLREMAGLSRRRHRRGALHHHHGR